MIPRTLQNPLCNYEANGVNCTFFTTNEFATIPDPDDFSYVPVSESAQQ